jgi:hypothetical protein
MNVFEGLAEAREKAREKRNEHVVAPWPQIDGAAYYGLAGEVVKTIEPHTEADPVAVLLQVLVFAGNVIGRIPYYLVEADRHYPNLFAALVGNSAKGRKGTSAGRARSVMQATDQQWIDGRMKSGLSSGEGLIYEVRDPVEKWDEKAEEFKTVDQGVQDKRLMITEAEFGKALAVMDRPGNILSSIIRCSWDGGTLSTLTKNSPLKATDTHISIVGHITEDELRARLTHTEACSGFANRFLFACVKRSQLLPHGGNLDPSDVSQLGMRMREKLAAAQKIGRVTMTGAAREEWTSVYADLSAERPGLLGAVTARAEAQVIRLSLVYALLDGVGQIDMPHLRAALALWEYCEASALRIFGDALGDPVADEILRALRYAGDGGMTRTSISDLFGRNRSADRIGAALVLLATHGRARMEMRATARRPAEVWIAIRTTVGNGHG